MNGDARIKLCFPCEHFRPRSADQKGVSLAGGAAGQIWPSTTSTFWEQLSVADPRDICRNSHAEYRPADNKAGRYYLECLNETWLIEPEEQNISKTGGRADLWWDSQLPFLVLVYLCSATDSGLSGEYTSPRDLFPGIDLFQSNLSLETAEIEKRYGLDSSAFNEAARRLGGRPVQTSDAGARFSIFPKFGAEYLLWLADDEFGAALTILVDRSTVEHVPADAVSVALNLLSHRIAGTGAH